MLNTPGCFRESEARCALRDVRSQLDGEMASAHVAEMEGITDRAEVETYRFRSTEENEQDLLLISIRRGNKRDEINVLIKLIVTIQIRLEAEYQKSAL